MIRHQYRMIRVLVFSLCIAASGSARGENVWYVHQDAAGKNNCTGWSDACIDLQDAIDLATPGDQIWVAAGRYTPDRGTGERSASFQLLNGVSIYGGFAGDETDFSQANPTLNPTILSGDLDGDDEPGFTNTAENSYHVVLAEGTDATAVLAGFTITAGNADAPLPNHMGSGLYCTAASPTISGCAFVLNAAVLGGGFYCDAGSNPTLTDCSFFGNHAASRGGGLYADVDSEPTLTRCGFTLNSSDGTGGGMYSEASRPSLANCEFSVNTADAGGGMFNAFVSEMTLTGCRFLTNSAGGGGGMYNVGGSNPVLTDCEFIGNLAGAGAGMLNAQSNPTLINCALIDNHATLGGGGILNVDGGAAFFSGCNFIGNGGGLNGGAMANTNASPTLEDCTFTANTAATGGAIFNEQGGSPTIRGSAFVGNVALIEGGAVSNFSDSRPIFSRCVFLLNTAEFGGAMYNRDGSNATITSCLFTGNVAATGGAMFNAVADAVLLNCTLSGNAALKMTGGIYSSVSSSPVVDSCILFQNRDGAGTGETAQLRGGTPLVRYSIIQGWTGLLGGVGNTGDDPLFVDPAGPDEIVGTGDENFRLLPGSPAISGGDPDLVLPPEATDLDGHARLLCERLDMGAYEFGLGDGDCDGDIDLADFAGLSRCFTGGDGDPYAPGCEAFDLDNDGTVGLDDFVVFPATMGGPGNG